MSLFRCETTLFQILHTSHNTVKRVVQNSAQGYILEVFNRGVHEDQKHDEDCEGGEKLD